MQEALWFSRHKPTEEQIAAARKLGYEIVEIEAGMKAGAVELLSEADVWAAADMLKGRVVFGVFPAPLREHWLAHPNTAPLAAFEAWNTSRPSESGPRTFAFKAWCLVYAPSGWA